ncbi:MAG: Hpt domain-containing protein [Prevotella sp.]|nr:Hpt domain-containing protein [Prevotella sp.]
MTIKEFYDFIGEDFSDVIGRLRAESRVCKYVLKFPADKSFDNLRASMSEKNYAEAFRAAHTIKGTGLNLGFNNFAAVASEITEKLRNFEDTAAIEADKELGGLIENAAEKYEKIISGIGSIDVPEQQ